MLRSELKKVQIDDSTVYDVPQHLTFLRKVGSGAYGSVAGFHDTHEKREIAIKKVANAFRDLVDAKRILREIRLLQRLCHENVLKIVEVLPPPSPDFDDIYIVTELMKTDLHKVIYSKQMLTEEHHQYFLYQILRGMLYLHSAGVLHRDLKPSNVLVNLNCDVKICDFGLARGLGARCGHVYHKSSANSPAAFSERAEPPLPQLTDYVVTRWYRAPEVILYPRNYTAAIDVWSIGCIFAELLSRKVLFYGRDHLDQLKQIFRTLGTPTPAQLSWLPHDASTSAARKFLRNLQHYEGLDLRHLIPQASESALDLLGRMLEVNPDRRISVRQALRHPYLAAFHCAADEPEWDLPVALDWSFDNFMPSRRELQNRIYAVAADYQPEIILRDYEMLKKIGFQIPSLPEALTRQSTAASSSESLVADMMPSLGQETEDSMCMQYHCQQPHHDSPLPHIAAEAHRCRKQCLSRRVVAQPTNASEYSEYSNGRPYPARRSARLSEADKQLSKLAVKRKSYDPAMNHSTSVEAQGESTTAWFEVQEISDDEEGIQRRSTRNGAQVPTGRLGLPKPCEGFPMKRRSVGRSPEYQLTAEEDFVN